MSKTRCRELKEQGQKLFTDRLSLMSYWQDSAEHYYPERADFTTTRDMGADFASHLMSSYPVVARRTLGDQFGAMLRPRGQIWAKIKASSDEINDDQGAQQWLEESTKRFHRALYEPLAHFVRATKEGDHDFAAFGQCVIEPRLRRNRDGLLFRCYHLRDVAWYENSEGVVDTVFRKLKLAARTLHEMFPDKVSEEVKRAATKEPFKEFECWHIVVPSSQYKGDLRVNTKRFPFMSIYIECENDTILEETQSRRLGYVIPRWQTVSGSQYGRSPAAVAGIADARLLQQMTVALLESSEKAATPPMIAVQEAVRPDIDLMAGGITWVEREYDEKTGEVLRPITQDFRGIGHGLEMAQQVREAIKEDFFLNKITLPEMGNKMTAFEVQERIKEFVRSNLPIFEPMESQYNGALCEDVFGILLDNGAFGGPDEMPDILRNKEVRFQFESPIQATADRAKLEAFKQVAEITVMAAQIDPGVVDELNLRKGYRDALDGAQAPADWKNDPEFVKQLGEHRAKQQKAQMALQVAEQAAGVADSAGSAVAGLMRGA